MSNRCIDWSWFDEWRCRRRELETDWQDLPGLGFDSAYCRIDIGSTLCYGIEYATFLDYERCVDGYVSIEVKESDAFSSNMLCSVLGLIFNF